MRVTQEQLEIGYMGESFRKCGGVGHYARVCPPPKGKGKGAWKSDLQPYSKGKSEGKGKSDHGDVGKGKSKGRPSMESASCAANVVIVLRIVRKEVRDEHHQCGGRTEDVHGRGVEHRACRGRGGGRGLEGRQGKWTMASNINAVPVESTFRPVAAGEITVDRRGGDMGKGLSVTGAGQASEVHERERRIHEPLR